MDGVGTGLCDDVDDAAWVTTGLGAGLSLLRVGFDGIEWQDDACNTEYAALVDGGNVVPEVVVVDAVDLPVDLIGASPIDGAEAAGGVAAEAGCDGDKLGEVATVHGRVVDDFGADVGGLGGGGRIERDRTGIDFHRGVGGRDGHLDGQRVGSTCRDGYLVELGGGEAGLGDGDGVGAKGQVLKEEFTTGGGGCGVGNAGVDVGGGHSCIGDKRALNVCYCSVDSASEGLCHR